MKYKIGDVARILGISPDLLRYYEKKGVVTPEKDKYTDYRYYEAWDINYLIDCIWFKNFGFSIEQIADMVHSPSIGELADLFEYKEDELRASIHRSQLLLERTEEHRKILATVEDRLYKCTIDQSSVMVRYLNRYNFLYDKSPDIQLLGQQWLRYMPFIRRCFEVDLDVLVEGGSKYAWGFALDEKYVREFGLEVEAPVVRTPSEKSICSVFSSTGKNNFSPKHLGYLLEYAEQNGLEPCGPARGQLMCSIKSGDEQTGYFEVWLPIK